MAYSIICLMRESMMPPTRGKIDGAKMFCSDSKKLSVEPNQFASNFSKRAGKTSKSLMTAKSMIRALSAPNWIVGTKLPKSRMPNPPVIISEVVMMGTPLTTVAV